MTKPNDLSVLGPLVGPIEFIEHPKLLGDKSLSPAQKMVIKAIYGLEMTAEELECWDKASGGRVYTPGVEQEETDICKGRKSGGTDKILTNCMLYEACMRPPTLAVGERAVLMIVTSELARQSQTVFRYCIDKVRRSPILRKLIVKATTTEISFSNGCLLQVFPANENRVRSPSLLFFGGDEVCFWKQEGKSIDVSVLEAARPGMIFPHSKMIKLSSVGGMRGEMHSDYKRFFGVDDAPVLVLKGSTEFFFPGFSKRKLERAKRMSPSAYSQEYEANFRSDESSMYDPDQIERAVNHDRPDELPYRHGAGPYTAFVDVAGGGGKDSYAIAIGHAEGDKVIVDVVRSRSPRPESFNPEEVTRQYCDLLKSYSIREVTGDKYGGDMSLNMFAKYGIDYRLAVNVRGTMMTKADIYIDAEKFFTGGRIEIPDREVLITQLQSLVRKTRTGGQDSVDSDGGKPEDEANVLCGVATKIDLDLGAGPVSFIGLDAGYCHPTARDDEERFGGRSAGGGFDSGLQALIDGARRRF